MVIMLMQLLAQVFNKVKSVECHEGQPCDQFTANLKKIIPGRHTVLKRDIVMLYRYIKI